MHSVSGGCPEIVRHSHPISLLISTLGIHLELGCKSRDQSIHYRTAKKCPKTSEFLSLILDEILQLNPEVISWYVC